MDTKDFRLFIDRVRMQALAAGQKTTLAHLVVQALEGLLRRDPANQTFLAARSELADRIISKTVFNEAEKARVRQQPSTIDTFQPDRTARELAAFAVKQSTGHGFDADVLAGLLASENYDGQLKETSTLWHAQEICRRHGVTRRLSLPTAAAAPAEKILEVIDDDWLYARTRTTIQGREQELRRGLAQLAAVFKKGAPLVITGARRVGKSLFLHHLLHRASNQWTQIAGHGIAKPTFLHVGKEAFLGNEQDVRNRLLEWHTHLCQHPEQVPVVDDFSHFRNPALPIARVFQETLGGMLASGGRTFVLVTDETGLRDELLGSAQRLVIKPLDPHSTMPLIADRLVRKLASFEPLPMPLAVATEPMGFSRELVALATEFYPGDAFPALGFDLVERFLDWYAGMVLVGDDAARYNGTATLANLKAFIAQDRGLEALDVDYAALAHTLKTDVIGQDHVITQVCRILDYRNRVSRAQLRPKGRFLFLGPPGVGKTQLAKRLAVRLFGTTPLRYNMSDFGGDGDRWRFIGSPRGYVGSDKRTLFDEVRENPNCVLLLDEIDRAHASIQDILLSMLEGEAVDGDHNTVYFSNVVFVMTTNLAKDSIAGTYEEVRQTRGTHWQTLTALEQADYLRRILADPPAHGPDETLRYEHVVPACNERYLRQVLLEGGRDPAEAAMRGFLEEEIARLKKDFKKSEQPSTAAIQQYLATKQIHEHLIASSFQRSRIDGAFLDRIDCLLPFFPLNEPELIARILVLKLREEGWLDSTLEQRQSILVEALDQEESVRTLERIIQTHHQHALGIREAN